MFETYEDLRQHQMMLEDEVRTSAYERAIREVVRPGMRVLDLGCGTGILAFFAERAGADRVYAVDRTAMLHVAESLARRNGLERITFLRADGGKVTLPEKVDVIVSEWMGVFAVQEGMLPAILAARDAHLVAGGVLVPNEVRLFAAPLVLPEIFEERSFFDRRPYGFDWSLVRDFAFDRTEVRRVRPDALATAPLEVSTLDVATLHAVPEHFGARGPATRDGTIHALAGWFDATLSPGVHLRTGPGEPPTHWEQLVFPLRTPIRVDRGEVVELAFSHHTTGGETFWHWRCRVGAREASGDTIAFRAFLRLSERR